MSKVISAGILLECDGKFLLGHPTELTGTTHGWGILKGRRDDNGETLLQTALREFKEESSLDLTLLKFSQDLRVSPRPFHCYDVGNKKTVYVFWVVDNYGLTARTELSCPSIVPGTNKPEIDRYIWAGVDEAIELVTESQKDMFRFVKQLTAIK